MQFRVPSVTIYTRPRTLSTVVYDLRRRSHSSLAQGAVNIKHRTTTTLSGHRAPRKDYIEVDGVARNASTSAVPPQVLAKSKRNNKKAQTVTTFDHTRLTPNDFVNLGRTGGDTVRVRANLPSGVHLLDQRASLSGLHSVFASCYPDRRFPRDARGFFYYHLAPNAPPLSGQLRFRITGTNDPALFASGHDLLRPNGLPWNIPLVWIALSKTYTLLRQHLLDDGLVSEDLMRLASGLPEPAQALSVSSTRVVHAFGQPFLLKFGAYEQAFYFIGADTVQRATLYLTTLHMEIGPNKLREPFLTGKFKALCCSALCCLEKSTLREHRGQRAVVCRILKLVEPVKATGIAPPVDRALPREGELMRKYMFQDPEHVGMKINFDKLFVRKTGLNCTHRFGQGLALLYDNETRAEGPVGW